MSELQIRVEGLGVRYPRRTVFADLDLTIDRFPAAITGANGTGKSTLLKVLGGLLQPHRGAVRFLPRPPLRIGYQPPFPTCLPWLSVRENLALALGKPVADRNCVVDALDPEFLNEHADRFPSQLSSGNRQKLTLLQALLSMQRARESVEHERENETRLLILDEPTKGLDLGTRSHLLALIRHLASRGTAVLFVVHEPGFILEAGARLHADLRRSGDSLSVVRMN